MHLPHMRAHVHASPHGCTSSLSLPQLWPEPTQPPALVGLAGPPVDRRAHTRRPTGHYPTPTMLLPRGTSAGEGPNLPLGPHGAVVGVPGNLPVDLNMQISTVPPQLYSPTSPPSSSLLPIPRPLLLPVPSPFVPPAPPPGPSGHPFWAAHFSPDICSSLQPSPNYLSRNFTCQLCAQPKDPSPELIT